MSGTLPAANRGFTPAAVAASQAGTTVALPPRAPPAPAAVFLFRLTAMMRIASMLNPIGILIYDGVFFEDVCDYTVEECWRIWHATFVTVRFGPPVSVSALSAFIRHRRAKQKVKLECRKRLMYVKALVALMWDIAVTVSLVRILRGRRGIPYMVHASVAFLVAAGVTVCFCFIVPLVVRRAPDQTIFASFSMIALMAVLMCVFSWVLSGVWSIIADDDDGRRIFCWNDVVWAIFGWKWMRKHKVRMLEMYGGARS